MGIVERAGELFRRTDKLLSPMPDPSFGGSKRFPNTCDWQVLKWMGIVTSGATAGGLGGKQVDFLTGPEVGIVVGMTFGFFGSIALANRVIERRLVLPRVDVADVIGNVIFPASVGGMVFFGTNSEGSTLNSAPNEVKVGVAIFTAAFAWLIAKNSPRYR